MTVNKYAVIGTLPDDKPDKEIVSAISPGLSMFILTIAPLPTWSALVLRSGKLLLLKHSKIAHETPAYYYLAQSCRGEWRIAGAFGYDPDFPWGALKHIWRNHWDPSLGSVQSAHCKDLNITQRRAFQANCTF